ncbi:MULTISPECIES: hypothetical protein [Nonomuraea]|uniref:Uncharacterized protein n=1 Tax=Nonomuraea mangrovi TaxID=2316207 RepID=A0ABW4SYT9_9ACTN
MSTRSFSSHGIPALRTGCDGDGDGGGAGEDEGVARVFDGFGVGVIVTEGNPARTGSADGEDALPAFEASCGPLVAEHAHATKATTTSTPTSTVIRLRQ